VPPPFHRHHPALLGYYVKGLRQVLHGPRRLIGFLCASTLHGIAHALVALVGSGLALSLLSLWGTAPPGAASGFDARDRLHWPGWLAIAGSPENRALWLTWVGLAVVLVKAAAGTYATYVQVRVAGQVGCALRLELFDALLSIHRLRHPRQRDHGSEGVPPSRAVMGLTERVREVDLGLAHGLLGGGRAVAQLVPIGVLLALLAPRMAAVAALVLAGFGWVLGRWRAGYRAASKQSAREHEQLLEAADEAVRHADLWVTFGAEAKARASVRGLGNALADRWASLDARASALSGANEVLAATALVAAVAAAHAGWVGAVAHGGALFAFAVAFFLAYRPLRDLADARTAFGRAQGAYDELREVIDRASGPENSLEPSAARVLPGRTWPLADLELQSLRVVHRESIPVTVRVEAGSIAVVMGPTGIGKTTLLRTLLGLEGAVGGDLLYGGESLGYAAAGPASRPFTWVPQDAPLLSDTLTANVGLGSTEAEARAALEPVGAAHLPLALREARLGAGGRAVSGGERQWIALARAIATGQPVLLLDEPTSGLDADAQRLVLGAIARLRGKRSVILVTHRSEPLAIADTVLRIDSDGIRVQAA
jgi:ABC-type multidrug transport system fused ATPase/permease subunit